MEFNKRLYSSRLQAQNYFNKESIIKISGRHIHPSNLSPKHTKVDSTSTTVENPRISASLNSKLLSHQLKNHSYKRAESELRQILNRSSFFRGKSEETQKKPILKNSNGVLNQVIRNYSSERSKDADLIINEYKSITNARVWDSFLDNLRANPKHLFDLIPISLTNKNSKTVRGRLNQSKLVKPSKSLKKTRITQLNNVTTQLINASYQPTPEIIESLKLNNENLTEDWSKSLLNHNIKYNNCEIDMFPGLSISELNSLLANLPATKENQIIILEKLNLTVEKLLTEMLGTQDDLDKFKEIYRDPIPSIIRAFTVKCLDIFKFREKTIEIIKDIINREKIIRELKLGEKKTVIEVHKLSKKIRESINSWLSEECSPFKKFIYKGQNYIEKINNDLVELQNILISS